MRVIIYTIYINILKSTITIGLLTCKEIKIIIKPNLTTFIPQKCVS